MQPFSLPFGRSRLFIALAMTALLAAGCSGENATALPDSELEPGVGGSGGGTPDGGSGGEGGGSDEDGGTDAPEHDAGGDVEADSPDIPVDYPASDVACERDVAFRADRLYFIAPTARSLGPVIEPFLADPSEFNFVLALRGSKGVNADGALSAADVKDWDSFFPDGPHKPSLASITLAQGRFDSTEQRTGFLKFQDGDKKSLTIQLQNIHFTAFTQNDCQQVVAMIDATVPNSFTNLNLRIVSEGQEHKFTDLAGMYDGDKYNSVAIRFMMFGEATNFDFASLPQ